jgi:hypothetical protein
MECKDTLQLFSLSYSCDTCWVWGGETENKCQKMEWLFQQAFHFSSYFKHPANRANGNNVQAKVPSNYIKISEQVMP